MKTATGGQKRAWEIAAALLLVLTLVAGGGLWAQRERQRQLDARLQGLLDVVYGRAATADDLAAIRALAADGARLTTRARESGMTALPLACGLGDRELVTQCIRAGVDVNAADEWKTTPVMLAAGNHPELISVLAAAGADVNAYDMNGATPLTFAAQYGDNQAVRELLKAGARIEARDARGRTPLAVAARAGQVETLRLLIAAGADVNVVEKNGTSALANAARSGNPRAAALLQKAGARVH